MGKPMPAAASNRQMSVVVKLDEVTVAFDKYEVVVLLVIVQADTDGSYKC